ncbi:MAG TPA: hypothetical protein VJS66_00100 [Burkholderiales bacterium]|nr:hypothetical protein [Burkholderiales bacterium]
MTAKDRKLNTLSDLNRLTAVTGPAPKIFEYDVLGNLTYKSDVGTYTYGEAGTKPHAVTATSGPLTSAYAYDENGSMTSSTGRSLTYTAFNKPSAITQGGIATSLAYDAHFNRIKKVTPSSTTIYVGKLYEKVTQGGVTEHKHYVGGIAVHTTRSSGTNDTRYLHTDHVGSIDTLTDENGAVVQRLAYDAHMMPPAYVVTMGSMVDEMRLSMQVTPTPRRGY